MEDPQLSVPTPLNAECHRESAGAAGGGDLLFAWLTPIGSKVDKRLRPKSPTITALPSPLNKAKSAFRRTLRSGHVSHKLRGDGPWALRCNACLPQGSFGPLYCTPLRYLLCVNISAQLRIVLSLPSSLLYRLTRTSFSTSIIIIIHFCCSLSAVREANDACLWLKAAGFPQYVQMFEGQFCF